MAKKRAVAKKKRAKNKQAKKKLVKNKQAKNKQAKNKQAKAKKKSVKNKQTTVKKKQTKNKQTNVPKTWVKEKVKKVIDGDTFETASGKVIRLADVDTPERGKPNYNEATEALKAMIDKKTVFIKIGGIGYFGRPIAEVKVGRKSVNKEMERYNKIK